MTFFRAITYFKSDIIETALSSKNFAKILKLAKGSISPLSNKVFSKKVNNLITFVFFIRINDVN